LLKKAHSALAGIAVECEISQMAAALAGPMDRFPIRVR
jgi:hypothetical protein